MSEDKSPAIQKKLTEIRREGEERDAERSAARSGLPYIDLRKTPVAIEAMKLVPEGEAKAGNVAAIQLKIRDVALAVKDQDDPATKKIISGLEERGFKVKLFIASKSGLEQAWHFYKFISAEAKEITGKMEIGKKRLEELSARLTTLDAVKEEILKTNPAAFTTTTLFEIVLAGALANRASDIHFEAEEKRARVRYRIDGYLHDAYDNLPLKNYTTIISRIKLLAGLKINVRGEPQDGRFTIGLTAKEIEMRVSIIPSEFGETVVMRILDPDSIHIGLTDLGFRPDDLDLVTRSLAKPNGLILNTGPTGSGKTTTLYAFLRKVNTPDIKIITIEDPVEYHLPGIEQTQVDPDAGYTFASGLRSILRQDPDVILVGEIRDAETADIAMQASLTGHMVFSTLHTNDAVGAVPRLVDLGVKPQTIGPALSLVIAQRLVRRLCVKCKKEKEISPDLRAKMETFLKKLPARVDRKQYTRFTLYGPVGCFECNKIGYRGRIGIVEFLEAGPDFGALIIKDASEAALLGLAREQEMVTMQQDGILKVIIGQTTLEEVTEVTGPIVW